ncbi:MAG: hypothetical protein FWG34_05840 [Oscillospiraceae bacterium]|nr:hypothetical protein [Oscillospiraceae bacterium]
MKKIKFAIFLAAVFVFFCLMASCADNAATHGNGNGGGDEIDSDSETGENGAKPDENIYTRFPKTDFGSRDFTMVIVDYMQEEHYAEEEIGDVFNDSVYNRNKKIEEDYNINLKFKIASHADAPSEIKKSVIAGDNAYDLGALHAVSAAVLTGDNIYSDWHKVPVINENLGNAWWNKSVENDMSIGGKSFFIAGDIGYIFTAHTHVFLFNKKLFADSGIQYPYDAVKEGKWTYDVFDSIIKECNQDLNGDGKLDIKEDKFGFVTMGLFGDVMYFYSFGGKAIEKDENDYPVLVLNSEKNASIVETGYKWFIENNCPVVPYTGDDDYSEELAHIAFHRDRAYFLGTNLKNLRVFRDMESEYGIIPFPRLDDAQENYISTVDGAATMLVLPKGADGDVSGTVAEAMARESSLAVIPAYYDSTLQLKFARDEATTEMLQIIKETAYFDMGYIYNFSGSGFISKTLLDQKSINLTSFCEKNEGAIQKAIDRLVEYCSNFE